MSYFVLVAPISKCIGEWLYQHPVLSAGIASAGFFYWGYEQMLEERRTNGIVLQCLGIILLLIYCIAAITYGLWVSLPIAITGIIVEVLLMVRWWAPGGRRN